MKRSGPRVAGPRVVGPRVVGLGVLLVLAIVGLFVARRASAPRTVNPADVLSPVEAEDGGTEPVALPAAPILEGNAPDGRGGFDFGYKVGGTLYAYHFALAFAPEADTGTMDLGVAKGQTDSLDQFPTERHWSETRKAFYVAVSHDLGKYGVPSLCVRAVLGPTKAKLDFSRGSLCVMQRDQDGRCHPTTLACGLLRSK